MSFNTSHVVVYPLKKGSVCWWWSFNTSHVVVYPDRKRAAAELAMFQYISCCSLSEKERDIQIKSDMFQYISCCSLSRRLLQLPLYYDCFNTSHVVVYLCGIF